MKAFAAFMQRYGVVVAFVVLFIYSAATSPIFLKPENLRNLMNQSAPVGIVAVGMTLVIIAGGIDLSVGSLMALAGAIGLWTMNAMIATPSSPELTPVLAGAAMTLVAGGALGAVNGAMVVLGRVAPFIATLVGLVAYRSFTVALSDAGEIRSESRNLFKEIGTGGIDIPFIQVAPDRPLTITWGILLFIVCALIAGFLLNWTRFGRYAVAVGANEKAARYSAVPVGRTKFLTYVLVGVFAGVAGILNTSKMESLAPAQLGQFYELDAIAAVVIGGTALRGGSGRIWGTVLGVLLLAVIENLLVGRGVSAYWQGVVKGGIILAAVLVQRGKE